MLLNVYEAEAEAEANAQTERNKPNEKRRQRNRNRANIRSKFSTRKNIWLTRDKRQGNLECTDYLSS